MNLQQVLKPHNNPTVKYIYPAGKYYVGNSSINMVQEFRDRNRS
jgi:hypothetical protein